MTAHSRIANFETTLSGALGIDVRAIWVGARQAPVAELGVRRFTDTSDGEVRVRGLYEIVDDREGSFRNVPLEL